MSKDIYFREYRNNYSCRCYIARRLYHTQFTLTMNLSSRKFFNESLAPMGASDDTLLEEYAPERLRGELVPI